MSWLIEVVLFGASVALCGFFTERATGRRDVGLAVAWFLVALAAALRLA